jgi:anti-sigma factor (TIGR02949 family)
MSAAATTCRELERALDAYVDGELDASHVLVIDAHLTACAPCSERVGLGRAVKRAIRVEARAESVPASLRARIERSAAEVRPSERVVAPAESARTPPSWRSALPWAAAAGVAIAAGGGMRSYGAATPSSVPELATASFGTSRAQILEDFAVQHARPLPPEEIDPARIAKVFSPIVGVPVHPIRFADVPMKTSWSFAGARLMALRDEPTATLYYENVGGTRVTVFVFDPNRISVRSSCCLAPRTFRKNGEERTVLVGHAKGYSLAVAERDGVGYALSGDLGEPEMVSLASNL